MPEIGFFTTIQNMIDVAKLNAYLLTISCMSGISSADGTYHVKMYWVWLFLRFTVGALPIGIPLGSRS